MRMAVQWIMSERERRSVVPTAFWWLSAAGGVMLFVYFCWRKDIVGVLGQSIGLLVYARNLWFIHVVGAGAPIACPHGEACPLCSAAPADGPPSADAGR